MSNRMKVKETHKLIDCKKSLGRNVLPQSKGLTSIVLGAVHKLLNTFRFGWGRGGSLGH